jgi:hypothetical protein
MPLFTVGYIVRPDASRVVVNADTVTVEASDETAAAAAAVDWVCANDLYCDDRLHPIVETCCVRGADEPEFEDGKSRFA